MSLEMWMVRAVKAYPEAHNHLLLGQVTRRDDVHIEMDCRVYDFGRGVASIRDVRQSEIRTRIIPWSRVEVIDVLPANFDYPEAKLEMTDVGDILISDGSNAFPIIESRGAIY